MSYQTRLISADGLSKEIMHEYEPPKQEIRTAIICSHPYQRVYRLDHVDNDEFRTAIYREVVE